ncbi:uncharacterized protein LOC134236447 [Saccostrea cucullata]|uniref:uncharacterized protein LOC134236447 n=1 Tax=Saccostrea cuccullata TaxID=36930 RepID=UPI002ED49B1A
MKAVIILILVLNNLIGSLASSCEKSIPTVAYVKTCPRTEAEWNAEAERKQCHVVKQNCTPQNNFQYHCLINAFANATVEVCAPARNIIGHCAEYNYGRQGIQDHQQIKCETCPSSYLSTEAYKYQECYKLVSMKQNVEISNSTKITCGESDQRQGIQSTSMQTKIISVEIGYGG